MPRTARASVGGLCYHVLNRGNGRAQVFHKEGDYAAFVDLLAAASDRLPVRILGYVLMPNHFHLVLWPRPDGDLSRWMQWLHTRHVRLVCTGRASGTLRPTLAGPVAHGVSVPNRRGMSHFRPSLPPGNGRVVSLLLAIFRHKWPSCAE